MASIIGLQQQEEALKEINATIKAVAIINKFLETGNPSKTYFIRFSDAEGNKVSTDLTADKEEIDKLLSQNKNEKRDYVIGLAQEFRIALSTEDKEILGIVDRGQNI